MTRPTVVLVGFMGKVPLAGMALANLHCIGGFQDLGYRVHYVERQNESDQCYDPATNAMTDSPDVAIAFLSALLPRYGIETGDWSFVDRRNRCHGAGWETLRQALRGADFLLDLGEATWFDELDLCPRRAFVDVDPMFTQLDMIAGTSRMAGVLDRYDTLFTYGSRMGEADCTVPSAGRRWIPAHTSIVTRWWTADAAGRDRPLSTVMNWTSGRDLTYEGRTYGYKNREFERFMDLPARTDRPCLVAMGGAAPRDRLRELGWRLANPLAVTGTIEAYEAFIAGSGADLGIAKHAYVASRGGWFSDRSTCYMACGRPVLHQDTGFGEVLPAGEGVLSFSTPEELAEGLRAISADYDRHSRAARAIVEDHFEAARVLGRMIEAAGWA